MKLDKQGVYDKVKAHLLAQGRPAFHPKTGCAYRQVAEGGQMLKCAIGCLIPDELYVPAMEGKNVFALWETYLLPLRDQVFEKDVDVDFLAELQGTHDDNAEAMSFCLTTAA